jgi:hypothetical protein
LIERYQKATPTPLKSIFLEKKSLQDSLKTFIPIFDF